MPRPQEELTYFAEFLDEALVQRGMSQNEFLKQVKVSKGTMAYLRRRPPPKGPDPKTVLKWAKVLGLDGDEADKLVEASQLACSPVYVRELVSELRRRLGE